MLTLEMRPLKVEVELTARDIQIIHRALYADEPLPYSQYVDNITLTNAFADIMDANGVEDIDDDTEELDEVE